MSDQYWLNDSLGTTDDNDMSSFLNFGDLPLQAPSQQQQQQQPQPLTQQQLPVSQPTSVTGSTKQEMYNSPMFNHQNTPHLAQESEFDHQNSINPSAILNQANQGRQDSPYSYNGGANTSNSNNDSNMLLEDPQTILNFRNSNNPSRNSSRSHFSPQVNPQQLHQTFNGDNNFNNSNGGAASNTDTNMSFNAFNNNNNNNINGNNSNSNSNSALDKNAMMSVFRQRQQQLQQQQLLQEQMKNMQQQQLLKQQMLQHLQQQQQQQQHMPSSQPQQPQQLNHNNNGNTMSPAQQLFYQQLQQQRMQLMQQQQLQQQLQQQQQQQQSANNSLKSPMVANINSNPAANNTMGSPYLTAITPQQVATPAPHQSPINPASLQQPHQNASLQQELQQKRQRQLNQQLQLELFMKTLQDFARRKGIAVPPNPVIDGRKIHLFFLYVLVSKLGGSNAVTRNNQWGFVASKFQLPVESNPNYGREVANFYQLYLFQFEQFAATQEGQREIYNIKISIQKQMQQQFLQMQQQRPQGQASLPVPPQQQQQVPQSQPPLQQQQQVPPQQQQQASASPSMHRSPVGISPMMNQQQTAFQMQQPPPPKKRRSTKGSKLNSPNVPTTTKLNSRKASNASQLSTPMSAQPPLPKSAAQTPAIVEEELPDPNIPLVIRNYAPHQRAIELVAGYDIPSLIQLGEHVDAGKPFYLFAPELGNVDLHAMTMSLSSGINSEINNALNTLLVTAADNHLMLQLRDCPDLLDAFCRVGLDSLEELISGNYTYQEEPVESLEQPKLLIDEVFESYMKEYTEPENSDQVLVVDSFTGELVPEQKQEDQIKHKADDDESSSENELFSFGDSATPVEMTPASEKDEIIIPSTFHIPSYTELLLQSRSEIEYKSTTVFQKSAVNHDLMLVERLSTLSIILRNLSFVGNNNEMFAGNPMMKEYLFKLVNSIATVPEKFMLARKKLSLLKDSLILLSGIADSLQLNDHHQALLVLVLSLSFCGDVEKNVDVENPESLKDDDLFIPCYAPKIQKFQPYAIDLFAKIVVRDPPNRELMKNVILGVYPADISDEENKAYQLTKLYLNGKDPRDGFLLSKTFSYMISVLPIYSIDNFIHVLEERKITVVQALLSCILLAEMFAPEDYEYNLAAKWLSTSELIGSTLSKIGSSLAVIKPDTNQELVIISRRCLTLLNLLLQKAIDFAKNNKDEDELKSLSALPKIFPKVQVVCAASINSFTDQDVLQQLLKLSDLEDEVTKILA